MNKYDNIKSDIIEIGINVNISPSATIRGINDEWKQESFWFQKK